MLQTETVLVVGGHPPIPGILISFYPASTKKSIMAVAPKHLEVEGTYYIDRVPSLYC